MTSQRKAKKQRQAELKNPQWGPNAPTTVVFDGYGHTVDPEVREADLHRFIGHMAVRGWEVIHRMPGAVLFARVHRANQISGAAAGFWVAGPLGAAVGASGMDQTVRAQAWVDETGRIFARGA
ncbi:hypothetical protein [Streptomyces indicus]|uniref:Uncharacterized protein n=1 Tax=Streptomyces indicus TaxID=417292 RepID=A0A1G8ZJ80_9ACTN|nr:hypothetical protein [Streptomyces indicus]SDK15146.1 hypothetical protein SAMN05421806_10527 [Streptomyces indicus]